MNLSIRFQGKCFELCESALSSDIYSKLISEKNFVDVAIACTVKLVRGINLGALVPLELDPHGSYFACRFDRSDVKLGDKGKTRDADSQLALLCPILINEASSNVKDSIISSL